MALQMVVSGFEDSIKKWIAQNVGMINFSHPQYTIRKVSDKQYDITMSLTGFGIQHFSLALDGDKFSISGKVGVVGSGASFPIAMIGGMVNDMMAKWLAQTVESLAIEKAKIAALKASKVSGKPVSAVITLMPESTTTNTLKKVQPRKTLIVSSTGKVTEKKD